MKIIVTESIADEGLQTLKDAGYEVDVKLGVPRDELLEVISDYDALVVRSATKVNEELLAHAKRLKIVGRAGNGVDNIDLAAATKYGVVIVNTPESNTVSAAEHTVGLLLATCRNISQADKHTKSGGWKRALFRGVELQGKTLGIVGLGRIGSMVATRMQSFGMKVIAYDPYITDERFDKFDIEKVLDVKTLVKASDFVSVHTPKTSETLGIIGADEFAVAKEGLRVVNCARGGIVDEQALSDAMTSGIVAGCGIDVLANEPNLDSPLLQHDSLVITPHLGASTYEAQKNVGVTVAKEVIAGLKGEVVSNAVNMPSMKKNEFKVVKNYMVLGEKLGKLYYQVEKSAVKKVEIAYHGELVNLETSSITLAVLKGLFDPILKEQINYVNAMYLTKQRGVKVVESKHEDVENYQNLITLTVETQDGQFTVSGTIFGKNGLRITNVNGFDFEVVPTTNMVFVENFDIPGMIGKIGTALGKEDVNIETMMVSQNCQREAAMMLLSVDQPINCKALDAIEAVEGIKNARFVSF